MKTQRRTKRVRRRTRRTKQVRRRTRRTSRTKRVRRRTRRTSRTKRGGRKKRNSRKRRVSRKKRRKHGGAEPGVWSTDAGTDGRIARGKELYLQAKCDNGDEEACEELNKLKSAEESQAERFERSRRRSLDSLMRAEKAAEKAAEAAARSRQTPDQMAEAQKESCAAARLTGQCHVCPDEQQASCQKFYNNAVKNHQRNAQAAAAAAEE